MRKSNIKQTLCFCFIELSFLNIRLNFTIYCMQKNMDECINPGVYACMNMNMYTCMRMSQFKFSILFILTFKIVDQVETVVKKSF